MLSATKNTKYGDNEKPNKTTKWISIGFEVNLIRSLVEERCQIRSQSVEPALGPLAFSEVTRQLLETTSHEQLSASWLSFGGLSDTIEHDVISLSPSMMIRYLELTGSTRKSG